MRLRRHWLLFGPLLLMALGLLAAIVSAQMGWAWPAPIAVVLPNIMLALLVAGAIAWLATTTKKGAGS